MNADGLKAVLGELQQAMPEAERRSAELARRMSLATERAAALLQRLEQIKGSLSHPSASSSEAVAQLAHASAGADENVRRESEGVAARLAGWATIQAGGQALLETTRDETAQAADALGQRLHEAREVLVTASAELSERATAFFDINDLARQRVDAALDVALEEAGALREESHRAERVLLERIQQLTAASRDHQQHTLSAARTTASSFTEGSERLAGQIERVRDDLVRSATLDMAAEVRRALLQETAPALEAARLATEEALSGIQRGVSDMRDTAAAVRTTLAPLMQELGHLLDALDDTVEFVRDAAHAAGCPF
jgi:hypothetical protein